MGSSNFRPIEGLGTRTSAKLGGPSVHLTAKRYDAILLYEQLWSITSGKMSLRKSGTGESAKGAGPPVLIRLHHGRIPPLKRFLSPDRARGR